MKITESIDELPSF